MIKLQIIFYLSWLLNNFWVKSIFIKLLRMWITHLLAQQHIDKTREVRYLSWFGQWYHVWSICWLLSIDQCFLLVSWRALVTLSVPIGFPVEANTTAGRRLASHLISATWTVWPGKYYSFVLSVVFLLSGCFCLLSDNWSNVLVCVISVSLPACNWLVSPPQHLYGLTLMWSELDQVFLLKKKKCVLKT